MPIYEYRCGECGHELETVQRISAPALTTCPSCHGEELKRLIGQTSFVLKGSGWYATDYKGKTSGANNAGTSSDSDTPSCDPGSKPECASCPAADSSA